ncbi:gliding motility-associated C-terminal domain-containing protein [Pedobacter fastidiosus]|uniref:Gliding motility-associated C-terminal domain-containing protein n=1 Tax=Pedobacter fastidiosus TaxID=2765361 RepID=A0ABR7KPV8_9SPHI|nr:gliding motility-associated C-terminal domain-containing protein [Pedobacter fastidiosus]MBC6109880.1 gliding motility-associated C-terminal domain-containing protein [Pedobacter fastidiosus]
MRCLIRILLLIILISFNQQLYAQVCTGTLGDPVMGAGTDFGNGTSTFGNAIPANTNYTYIAGTPDDGQYTIVKSTAGLNQGWLQDITNHTGDANGYMMVVNANFNKGIFYQSTVNNLCPNTTYEFASYIINILRGTGIKPNVKFTIENNGVSIKEFSTGDILEGSSSNWVKYGTIFTTPANVGIITIKMTNENPGGGGNDLALDDITFRACGPTIIPSINNGPSTAGLCEGMSASFNLAASVSSGYTDPVYQWQINTGNGWNDLPGETAQQTTVNFANASTGTYLYRLLAAERANITSTNCRIASAPLTIVVTALPNPIASSNGPVCIGSNIQLNVTEGTTFAWTGPNGFTSTLKNPIIANASVNMTGDYTVTATTNGCSRSSIVNVQVLNPIIPSANFYSATVCQGNTLNLEAFGGTSYSWFPTAGLSNPNSSQTTATPLETTTYTVTVSNGTCSETTQVTINIIKNATADAGNDQKILNGQKLTLNGKVTGDNVSYYWTPSDFLDDPTKLNPIANPPTDITYTLHAQSNSGCLSASDDVFIKVYPKIVIPNSFSPNGDSVNDTWNIPAAEAFPNPIIKVTNRYGQLVYQSTGKFKPWDGKYNGKDLPTATYYYSIYFNSDFETYTGWIMLIR